jgi:hypothetical protein
MDLLRTISRWVLLSTCDHDGIVASYRLLKGLSDNLTSRPSLSLALLEAKDETEANRVAGKLGNVCSQFLSWNLETEGTIGKSARVAEHMVLNAHLGAPFSAVAQFISEAQTAQQVDKPEPAAVEEEPMDEGLRQLVADLIIPTETAPAQFPRVAESQTEPDAELANQGASEVLDLDGGEATPEAVVNLILKQTPSGAIECPVRAPMCAAARLTVTREKTLELFASTERGLGNLRGIAQAYRWLTENRGLIAMAMPQFAIDAARLPRLRLIVDQADMSAGLLEPMLQNAQITVQTFRRLRWGTKTGLLLEAA